jgi:hypothetical protein
MNAFAAVFPALGVSYYRVRISEVRPPTSTAQVPADRQDSGAVASGVRSRALNEFGVTVAQSLGRHFIVGTTLKLLRGGGAFVEGVPADAPLDVADGLSIEARTKSDLDVGMMASFAHVRLGMAVRNVFEPDMGTKAAPLILERQARAGMAVITSKFGPVDALTISADADLTRTFTVFGDARHVAVGGELWVLTRHLGVRGGASANTVGDKRTALSAGVSVAAYRGIYVDVFRAFGLNRSLKGWGTALRVTF